MAKSNICVFGSKSLPNMRGVRKRHQSFMACWKRSQDISNFLEIPAELKTAPANNWRTPTYVWQLLEPKIWMLDLAMFLTFASFANRSRSCENTPQCSAFGEQHSAAYKITVLHKFTPCLLSSHFRVFPVFSRVSSDESHLTGFRKLIHNKPGY